MKRRTFTTLVTGLTLAASLMGSTAMAQDKMRIALVVKALGIGFFEAAARRLHWPATGPAPADGFWIGVAP